jgi:hypothetical protein
VYASGNPAPDFVKIDVEGAEESVLRGADRLLREARPTLLTEVRVGESCEHVPALLRERGYRQVPLASGPRLEQHEFTDILFVPD